MSNNEYFKIRPFTESDIDNLIENAGGVRAHLDASSRSQVGGDYKLGRALIELKALDEEGFNKEERQKRLSELFQQYETDRPVIVLDRHRLKPADRKRFDRIIETPIKQAVKKASRQLKQSRTEFADTNCSVLMVLNNGYMSLDHEILIRLVERRARQDTSQIDSIVVAGMYYHSDDREGYLVPPIVCIPINKEKPFVEFERLKNAWDNMCESYMKELAQKEPPHGRTKAPITDIQFEIGGITYIRPAPAIGGVSEFYPRGRPRKDSVNRPTDIGVGKILPFFSEEEWAHLRDITSDLSSPLCGYDVYKRNEAKILGDGKETDICPLVKIPLDAHAWRAWCSKSNKEISVPSAFEFACEIFKQRIDSLIGQARELEKNLVTPSQYVLSTTEIIGQDQANDISHIIIRNEMLVGAANCRTLVKNARIPREHAIALAAAYAVREGISAVMWSIDTKYAWF